MKLSLKIILLVGFVTIFLLPKLSLSDVAFLKNGKQIAANKIWEQNGKVICSINGNTITLNSADVLRIVQKKDSTKDNNSSFHFDVWKSGMDIEEILSTSRRYDVPLHKSGIISINKKFNPNTSSKYAKTATHYYYKTKLLGKHAKVDLFLTHSSKKLHTLTIDWHGMANKNNSSGFEKEITYMLSTKYGTPKKQAPQIFGRAKKWIPSAKITIDLKMTSGNYVLTYRDIVMAQLNKNEQAQRKAKIKQQYQSVDNSKF
ncbi:MAG: hypothetical protein GY705_02800 [Bacteroidetes bacterium]|nr:hypothetical protein [Bacteroidota bacterium]